MALLALRSLATPHSVLLRWRSQPLMFRFAVYRKRYVYNVLGLRYTPCVGGEYHLWEPEADGHFFCQDFPTEDFAQYSYRSGGYHPVHLGDTMQGGRYHIVQKFGWGRDATVWLAGECAGGDM